jgi:hypothetical protein
VTGPGSRAAADAASTGDPALVADYLARSGQPFLLLSALPARRVRLRFTGPFAGAQVVWNCEFIALQRDDQPCFIEVGEPTVQGVPLAVGLPLPSIDQAAVLKMMVMIRNYKRLQRGRHEFGRSVG